MVYSSIWFQNQRNPLNVEEFVMKIFMKLIVLGIYLVLHDLGFYLDVHSVVMQMYNGLVVGKWVSSGYNALIVG